MESGDGNSGSANGENNVEEGKKCEKVEEMAKLKEESVKTNGSRSDQAEKTKGKGLKKWKRRPRETSKDARHVQEPHKMVHKRVNPHAGRLDTSKEASGGNRQKNEVIESEPSVGNHIAASSSMLGFAHPDRESNSGSWNAVVNAFPIGYGEDQSCTSFPKTMAENLATEELLNEFEFGLFENREDINYLPLYGDEIELPIGLGDFESGDRKRPTGPTKKARAEKFEESNLDSKDPPIHEHDESSISTGGVVFKCEGISGNHIDDFSATCILSGDKQDNVDDLGESSCSTANNLGISVDSASGHSNAVMTRSGSNVVGSNKQENLDDLGESSCSTANNLGSSAVSASGPIKAVMAKSGSNASLGNGKWTTEELRLWYENFDPENSTFERQSSEETQIFESQERLSVSHDRFTEGEDIKGNPVLMCDVIAHSEESFTSAATVGAKKREGKGDSQAHVNGSHLQPTESDCLVQALTQLKTAEEALQKEVQQMKDLGKQVEGLQMKDCEHAISSESESVSNHLQKYDAPDVPNGFHVEEKAEIKWPSATSQLNKLNEQLKLLQKELDAANHNALSEQTEVKELEVQCKEQEIKLEETKLPSEGLPSELQLVQEKCKEMEMELEEQYKEKMQAEIEFLLLNNATKRSIAVVENETSLLQEQKALAIEQLQTALKLKHAEGRALSLKDHLIELENACGSLSEMEEVLTLHNK
ncbi:hypothetical protein KI387_028016, partial [Taxus chinensis]